MQGQKPARDMCPTAPRSGNSYQFESDLIVIFRDSDSAG